MSRRWRAAHRRNPICAQTVICVIRATDAVYEVGPRRIYALAESPSTLPTRQLRGGPARRRPAERRGWMSQDGCIGSGAGPAGGRRKRGPKNGAYLFGMGGHDRGFRQRANLSENFRLSAEAELRGRRARKNRRVAVSDRSPSVQGSIR